MRGTSDVSERLVGYILLWCNFAGLIYRRGCALLLCEMCPFLHLWCHFFGQLIVGVAFKGQAHYIRVYWRSTCLWSAERNLWARDLSPSVVPHSRRPPLLHAADVTVSEAEEGSLQVAVLIWWRLLSSLTLSERICSILSSKGEARRACTFAHAHGAAALGFKGKWKPGLWQEAWLGIQSFHSALLLHLKKLLCAQHSDLLPRWHHTLSGLQLQQYQVLCLSCLVCLRLLESFTYVKQPLCDPVTKSFILSAPSRSKLR